MRAGPQRGFSYIGLLILVAIMGVAMAATGDLWQTTRQREKEDELLWVGDQFRQAIQHFYQQTPGRGKRYPLSIEDLLKDPRYPNTRRYLRKIYIDPVTGTADWGLVKGPNGEIYGVYSQSEAEPIKQASFKVVDAAFEGLKKYSDWKFMYILGQNVPSTPQAPPQANVPSAPQGPQQSIVPVTTAAGRP